jgi:hypothetical protein
MSLPPCTFERGTKRAVCRAYKAEYAEGWRATRCYGAGIKVIMERHPDVTRSEASAAVILIIATASRDYPDWVVKSLRNVPYYPVPREHGGQPEGYLEVTTDEYRTGKVR